MKPALAAALLLGAILFVITALRIDVSAARFFRRDAVVRDAFPAAERPNIRYLDPSPHTIWIPAEAFLWDSLHAGKLPLWERRQGGGYSPVIAFYEGVFHPVRWLACLFPRELMPTIVIAISLFAAAAGTALFLLPSGWPAAIAGGLLFAFSAPLISTVHFSGSLLPLAHLPWILWFYRRAADTPSARRFAALALAIALLLLSGHPLIEFTVALGAAIYALADWNRRALLLPAAGVAGLLLVSFALLPPLLAAPDSWTYKTTTGKGLAFHAYSGAQWLSVMKGVLVDEFPANGCCIDGESFFDHVGEFRIALLIAAVVAGTARRSLVLTAVCALLALPGPWMKPFEFVPPISYIKPWYFSGIAGFWLSVAAAAGGAYVWRKSRIVAIAILAGVFILDGRRALDVLQPRRWKPVVAGDAVAHLRGARVTGLPGEVHLPNASRITGIDDARLVAPFFPMRMHLWWLLVDRGVMQRSYPTMRATDRLTSPLVGDFNIAYVLEDRLPPLNTFYSSGDERLRDRALSPNVAPPQFPVVAAQPSLLVFGVRGAKPRAHFLENGVRADDIAAAFRLLSNDSALSVVESANDLPLNGRGSVRVTYPDDAHVQLDTTSDSGGVVVLHDTWADGWRAEVDGKDAAVLPVNILSRGVVVPRGAHRVTMSYMPPGLAAGALMSLVTAAALLLLIVRGRR